MGATADREPDPTGVGHRDRDLRDALRSTVESRRSSSLTQAANDGRQLAATPANLGPQHGTLNFPIPKSFILRWGG